MRGLWGASNPKTSLSLWCSVSVYGHASYGRRYTNKHCRPGQILPKFPKPTHSIRRRHIFDALEEVNRYPHRDVSTVYDCQSPIWPPQKSYDPRVTIAYTITTNGGKNYHWTGRRYFTIRELLALQTFPVTYKFGVDKNGRDLGVTEIRTQIGNAVPPRLARMMFECVLEALQKTDETR